MSSAFGTKSSHRRCLLLPANRLLLLLAPNLCAACWASRRLFFLTIRLKALEPVGIDGLLGKAGQLGQELMGRFGEHRFGLVLVGDAHHVASVAGGEVENRLTQANEDVLRLTLDQLPADQLAGFFFGLRLGQEGLGAEFGVPDFQVIFRKLADPLASDF